MSDTTTGELLALLPKPYHADPGMQEFLLAFERMLLANEKEEGLEEKIGQIPLMLDPLYAIPERLPWLASWMGLSIDADFPTHDKALYRKFVAQTIARYHMRGTEKGMKELLGHFTGQDAQIWSTDKSHSFVVTLDLDRLRVSGDINELERLNRVARALIQREKPAHTCYELRPRLLTFQIAVLDETGDRRTPSPGARIASPAQLGGRVDGKVTVGNMILGQAPATAPNKQGEIHE